MPICDPCTTNYALGLSMCPHCASTETVPGHRDDAVGDLDAMGSDAPTTTRRAAK